MPDYSQFQIILDQPSAQPALGFPEYVTALHQIIDKSSPRFAIGIFGSWGSGKTTLMTHLESELDRKNNITVPFSAWRFEKEAHLIVPLLDSVREAVVCWADEQPGAKVKNAALKVATAIGQATYSLLHGFSLKVGVPNAIEASFEANKALERAGKFAEQELAARVPRSFYLASFKSLRDAFGDLVAAGGRRIVVFIDDLDRCLPEGALEVLESMKLFFDIEGFVFVVGLDRAVVEKCIDAKYAKELVNVPNATELQVRGEDYIKKIFQVPFNLAPVSTWQIRDYLESICSDTTLSEEQRDDLRDRVGIHLAVISAAGVNPREIKRFINSYVLQMKIKPHLDPDAVLAVETIRFRREWAAVGLALLQYRQLFITALASATPRESLVVLDQRFETAVPDSFLRYVSPLGAGHALTAVYDVDEYLYGGEATKSSLGPVFIDLIRDASEIRVALATATTASELRPYVEKAQFVESRLREGSWGAVATRLVELASSIQRRFTEQPTEAAHFSTWRDSILKDADALVQQLANLYQSTG